MDNVNKNVKTALNIYKSSYNSNNIKNYCKELFKAVIREYRSQGKCTLINSLISSSEQIDAVTYIALENVYENLNKNKNKPYDENEYFQNLNLIGIDSIWLSMNWNKLELLIKKNGVIKYNNERMNLKFILMELKNLGKKYKLREISSEQNINNRYEENKSDFISKKDIIKYLSEERAEIKKYINEKFGYALKESILSLEKYDKTHKNIYDVSNNLQANWIKALDENIDKLQEIKKEFYKQIKNWQNSLYSYELRPLAERYLELYKIVNIDKIIAEEISRINSKENDIKQKSNNLKQGENIKESKKIDSHTEKELRTSSTLDMLEKFNKSLTVFLRKFELDLERFGMYVYHPKRGDKFDNLWHILEDDTNFNYKEDYEITGCIEPGVAKKINDFEEDDVIIPAIVSVRKGAKV